MKKLIVIVALAFGVGAGFVTAYIGGDELSVLITGVVVTVITATLVIAVSHPRRDGGDGAGAAILRLVAMTVVAGLVLYAAPSPLRWWGVAVISVHVIWGFSTVGMTTRLGKSPGSATIIIRDGGAISGNIGLLLGFDVILLIIFLLLQFDVL